MPFIPPDKHFNTFQEALTAAVADIAEYGYDDEARIEYWTAILRGLTEKYFGPVERREDMIRRSLNSIYDRQVGRGVILKQHPKVTRFTLDRVAPELRWELDRRIVASANLIKINREKRIDEVLQRFQGWATSVPVGGSQGIEKREVKKSIGKTLQGMDYIERRVAVDQGHKLIANISHVLAIQSEAIAGSWRQHWTAGPRESHKELNGKVFVIRDSWAYGEGLIKPISKFDWHYSPKKGDVRHVNGFTDEIDEPATPVNCRCGYRWIADLRTIEQEFPEMLTQKGRDYLNGDKTVVNG